MRSHEILDFCDLNSLPQSFFEITVDGDSNSRFGFEVYACTLGGSVIGIAPFMYLERVLLSLTVPLHSLRAGTPCSSLHSQSFQVTFSGNITNSYSATPGSLLHRPIHVAFTLPRSSASWHLPGLGLWPVVVISTLCILLSVLLLYLPGKA